ncbi:MAG: hypothetical protein JSS53_07980 [Proteobacteria bacterium]|nr:hypothetical protein [Pseudomonadota bacterium]
MIQTIEIFEEKPTCAEFLEIISTCFLEKLSFKQQFITSISEKILALMNALEPGATLDFQTVNNLEKLLDIFILLRGENDVVHYRFLDGIITCIKYYSTELAPLDPETLTENQKLLVSTTTRNIENLVLNALSYRNQHSEKEADAGKKVEDILAKITTILPRFFAKKNGSDLNNEENSFVSETQELQTTLNTRHKGPRKTFLTKEYLSKIDAFGNRILKFMNDPEKEFSYLFIQKYLEEISSLKAELEGLIHSIKMNSTQIDQTNATKAQAAAIHINNIKVQQELSILFTHVLGAISGRVIKIGEKLQDILKIEKIKPYQIALVDMLIKILENYREMETYAQDFYNDENIQALLKRIDVIITDYKKIESNFLKHQSNFSKAYLAVIKYELGKKNPDIKKLEEYLNQIQYVCGNNQIYLIIQARIYCFNWHLWNIEQLGEEIKRENVAQSTKNTTLVILENLIETTKNLDVAIWNISFNIKNPSIMIHLVPTLLHTLIEKTGAIFCALNISETTTNELVFDLLKRLMNTEQTLVELGKKNNIQISSNLIQILIQDILKRHYKNKEVYVEFVSYFQQEIEKDLTLKSFSSIFYMEVIRKLFTDISAFLGLDTKLNPINNSFFETLKATLKEKIRIISKSSNAIPRSSLNADSLVTLSELASDLEKIQDFIKEFSTLVKTITLASKLRDFVAFYSEKFQSLDLMPLLYPSDWDDIQATGIKANNLLLEVKRKVDFFEKSKSQKSEILLKPEIGVKNGDPEEKSKNVKVQEEEQRIKNELATRERIKGFLSSISDALMEISSDNPTSIEACEKIKNFNHEQDFEPLKLDFKALFLSSIEHWISIVLKIDTTDLNRPKTELLSAFEEKIDLSQEESIRENIEKIITLLNNFNKISKKIYSENNMIGPDALNTHLSNLQSIRDNLPKIVFKIQQKKEAEKKFKVEADKKHEKNERKKQKKLEEEKRKQELEKQKKLEGEQRKQELEKQKKLEEEQRKQELEKQKKLEEEQRKQELEKQKKLEEEQRKQELEKQKKLEEEQRKQELEKQKKLEEEQRKQELEKQKKLEEEQRKQELEKQKKLEGDKFKKEKTPSNGKEKNGHRFGKTTLPIGGFKTPGDNNGKAHGHANHMPIQSIRADSLDMQIRSELAYGNYSRAIALAARRGITLPPEICTFPISTDTINWQKLAAENKAQAQHLLKTAFNSLGFEAPLVPMNDQIFCNFLFTQYQYLSDLHVVNSKNEVINMDQKQQIWGTIQHSNVLYHTYVDLINSLAQTVLDYPLTRASTSLKNGSGTSGAQHFSNTLAPKK